ncbi:MAG TPA: hypothetical protein VHJ54_10865 [Solirubrobacterales bacterium]|nr:hypothetical protein [Solirubrobacterales bacterium]
MAELPFVDEHALEVDAPPELAWEAIVAMTRGAFSGRGGAPSPAWSAASKPG